MDTIERKLGCVLSDALKTPDVDPDAVAAAGGISKTLLGRAAAGSSRLSAGTWRKIFQALGIDYDKVVNAAVAEENTRRTPMTAGVCLIDGSKSAGQPACAEPEQVDRGDDECRESGEGSREGVLIHAPQEDVYALFLFCEEMMRDCLRAGTRMEPEQLYRLMSAMYALKDASLRLQEGETVTADG